MRIPYQLINNIQVPALTHDDFILTESRAIMMYLASLANSPLYPINDLKKRALIDSRLFFDATNSFIAVKNFAVSKIFYIIKLLHKIKFLPI